MVDERVIYPTCLKNWFWTKAKSPEVGTITTSGLSLSRKSNFSNTLGIRCGSNQQKLNFVTTSFLSLCAFLIPLKKGGCEELSEEVRIKRVNNHLLIRDKAAAFQEARKALEAFPNSKSVQTIYLKALCENKEELQAWQFLQKYIAPAEEPLADRHILEMLAWGVLNKAESSNQVTIRLNSLLAAAFTRDVKAVPILAEQMRSPNAMLRCIAIKLAASYGDACLKNQIAQLVREEKVWYVRLDAIQAAGHLRILELKPYLKEIIAHPKTLAEEKASAIIALVSMYDLVGREELIRLAQSDRAGLRQLACEIICHLNAYEHLDLITPLLKDPSSDVRLSVLNTLGLMKAKEISDRKVIDWIQPSLDDPSPQVAITAAWCGLLAGSKQAEERFQFWLAHKNVEYVRLASAALSVSGRYGKDLSLKNLKTLKDPYARANLALGLIGQREHVGASCQILYHIFCSEKETLWMWDHSQNPLFRSLAPSDLSHVEHIPHYPLAINQMTRLEILSVLSILRFAKAQEAVRDFLQTQTWGVVESAAFTLLQEGDEEDLTLVRQLLSDPDEKMRIQAALILGMVGGDPEAVKVLQAAYPHVDRQMKVHILEALAHIGDPQSIPFFLEIFKEPFQVMRVIAASALIQCLYH